MAYTPINAVVAGNKEVRQQEVDKVKAAWAASGGTTMTTEEKVQKYGDIINQTLGGTSHNSATGYYTNDAANAQKAQSQYGATVTPTTYNGQGGYYSVDGQDRTVGAGGSGADEDLMSDGDYAIIQQLKAEYEAAKARGDTAAMNAAHQEAERIRAGYGYLGGTDGSMYITLGETGLAGNNSTGSTVGASSGYNTGVGSESTQRVTLNTDDYLSGDVNTDLSSQFSRYDPSELKSLLEEWKAAAVEQSNGQIDYAVQQAVTELERALEDAQPQFKEQAEAVTRDEMQGLDNSALYAEARGDKGGIGQSQYNEIQAAAAQNRLAVQQAQTKLSTDTARQIADLRAQGEFEKADAALEISQAANSGVFTDDVLSVLRANGYTDVMLEAIYGYNAGSDPGGTSSDTGRTEETSASLDGRITENTLAWAQKVLSAQNGSVDTLAAALEKRGFSEEDIIKILLELGISVTAN